MPPEQSKADIRTLEVRGNLKRFFNGEKSPEVILDGPAGTGKTRVLLERQHYIQMKYPGARGVIARKFRSSMNETCLEVMKNDILKQDADGNCIEGVRWRERDQKWLYPNGSETIVCGLDEPQKLMSSRYDWIYFNEAIELKLAEWETAKSRLRNFKVPYQQMLGDTNPGPPTHWIIAREKQGKLVRYPTSHKDNPVYWNAKNKCWTPEGEAYVNGTLRDGMTGLRYDRLYLGKWVAAEGQVYKEFVPETHIVPRRIPPVNWPHYWVFDFGYIDPFVWQDWVEDPETGVLYLYQELYHSYLRVQDACEIIKQKVMGTYPPMALICDHDAENRATLEKEFGYLTLPAYKIIHPGIQGVQRRLQVDTKIGGPMIRFMENPSIKIDPELVRRHKPTSTLEEFDCYVWNTAQISLDKYKDEPVDRDNHGMDAMRYMVAFHDDLAIDPAEIETVVPYNELDDYFAEDMQHDIDSMISLF